MRAARLAVHQRDFAVLFLVIVEDAEEVADLQFLVGLLLHDRAQRIEQLARIEPVALGAADGFDDLGEMVEHHVLLRHDARARPADLADRLGHGFVNDGEERGEVRLLAVRGDRHVGRSDVEPDVEFQLLGRFGDRVTKPAAEQVDLALVALQRHFAGDRGAIDGCGDEVLLGLLRPDLDRDGDVRAQAANRTALSRRRSHRLYRGRRRGRRRRGASE